MIDVVERVAAILTVLAGVIAVGTFIAIATRRVPSWLREVAALPTALAIAIAATLGSLFMSEIAGYTPCELCWYQRIAMYPLVVVLGVAAWRDDRQAWRIAVPLAGVGLVIAAWHVAIERRPALGGVCDPAAPCSLRWVEEFGFLTLPMMAGVGFIAIIALTLAARTPPDHVASDHDDQDEQTTPTRAP